MVRALTEGGSAAGGQVHGAFFSRSLSADELRERERQKVTSPFIQRPTPAASQCNAQNSHVPKGYYIFFRLPPPSRSLKAKASGADRRNELFVQRGA
jgi:hypothetical protein